MSWRRRALLAAVSGASAWPLSYALDAMGLSSEWWGYALIGATFGALVLVPFLLGQRQRVGRVIALVLGSILIYASAVELAIENYGPLALGANVSIIVSGLLGALLVGALAKFAVPLQTSSWFWGLITVAGALGGLLFSLLFDAKNDFLPAAGYVGWQVAVCLALHKGTTSNSVLERTRDG